MRMAGLAFLTKFRLASAGVAIGALACAQWAAAQQPATQPPPPSTPPSTVPAPGGVTTPATPAPAPIATPAAAKPVAANRPAAKPAAQALDKPLWRDLSPAQKIALEPFATEWNKLPGTRKQKWLEIANRFAAMKPDEQHRVHEKMRDWLKLTPEQRRVARENYTRAKKIEPATKSAQWEQYQQLPDEQKKKLAADAAKKKKQVANLPPASRSKPTTVAPIQKKTMPSAVKPAPPAQQAAPVLPATGGTPSTTTPASPVAPPANAK